MADHTETERRTGTAGGDGVSPAGAAGGPQTAARRRAWPKPKPPGYFEGETMTRRAMFTGGALAAGGIAGAAIMLPAIGFALGPVFEEKDFPWQDVGPPGNFVEDNYTPVTFSMVTDVGEAGKTLAYVRKRNPSLDTDNPDEFIAISTRCAHLGCPVRWVEPGTAVRVPVSRRRLRRPGPGRGRPAGAAAGPVQDPGAERAGPARPALQRQLRSEALLRARPG